MNELISSLQSASTVTQSLAVTAGGLVGVFFTLFLFWGLIAISEVVGKKDKED